MTLATLIKILDATTFNVNEEALNQEVTGAYISDLLSDVMGHAQTGQIWMTIQTHPNVVAVALLLNLAAIVFTAGQQPEEQTIKKAIEEGVALLSTPLSTFEASGRLHHAIHPGEMG